MSDDPETTAIAAGDPAPGPRPRRDATLVIGDHLNGIYKVQRFVARGGMGEVFEGVNIETEERVAIKAIRSHLASDPKIIALFRKEARVLMDIAHPAIVQYRVFARDPLLDLHYIVTDFVQGEPITAYLGGERPPLRDVVILARRLAAGLGAAHDRGAVHRDMSPDNVLLPDGRIERAKIIDFGIAKSLEIHGETVVGDGFAGKLGYVAPEQFGDFGRQVGPWTDVYSTALVLLAYARGKAPPMGTTLSEAVERRRGSPDLADLPLALVPLLERMLLPDPAARIRSMHEVLDGLDGVRLPEDPPIRVHAATLPEPVAAAPVSKPDPAPVMPSDPPSPSVATLAPASEPPVDTPSAPPRVGTAREAPPAILPERKARSAPAQPRRRRRALVAVPILGALAVGAFALHRAPDPTPVASASPMRARPVRTIPVAPSAADRATRIGMLLASLPCTWVRATAGTEGSPTVLSGGARDLHALSDALDRSGGALGPVETSGISPVDVAQCGAIDALRPYRSSPGASDSPLSALSITMSAPFAGKSDCARQGTAEISFADPDPRTEFALLLLGSDGTVTQIVNTRAAFARAVRAQPTRFNIGADGTFHASLCSAPRTAAVFLLVSDGPVDLGLRPDVASPSSGDFSRRIADQGRGQQLRVIGEWIGAGSASPKSGEAPLVTATADSQTAGTSPPPVADVRKQRAVQAGADPKIRPARDTTEANRLELKRIAGLSAAPVARGTALAASSAEGDVTCRVFDGQWKPLGKLDRDACIARAFHGHCEISFAVSRGNLIRRQGGHIQEKRGSRWKDVTVDSGC